MRSLVQFNRGKFPHILIGKLWYSQHLTHLQLALVPKLPFPSPRERGEQRPCNLHISRGWKPLPQGEISKSYP
jgi:hypothetical protein